MSILDTRLLFGAAVVCNLTAIFSTMVLMARLQRLNGEKTAGFTLHGLTNRDIQLRFRQWVISSDYKDLADPTITILVIMIRFALLGFMALIILLMFIGPHRASSV